MTKTLLNGMLAVIIAGTTLTSCKKEKENVLPTAKDHLVGKWEITHFAYDKNYNSTIDRNEKEEVEDGFTYLFKPDGTGVMTYSGMYTGYPEYEEEENFTWSFQNGEKELRLIAWSDHYGNDTTYATITGLDDKQMILQDEDDYGPGIRTMKQWIFFEKIPLQ